MKYFLLGLAFCSLFSLSAQDEPYFGASVGICVANQTWDAGSDVSVTYLKPQIGMYLGANMEFYSKDQIGLMTELGFIQKGTQLEWRVTNPAEPIYALGTIEEDYKLNYLQCWVAVKLKADLDQLKPYVLLGPRLDVQLSEVKTFPNSNVKNVSSIFGGVAGAGFQYIPRRKNYRIYVQGIYLMDFIDMHYTSSSETNTALTIRNSAFLINVGVQTRIIYGR
jgi:hypothetical protein